MSGNPNKLSQFWQELKRRKVLRVFTVYAAASFVILQLVEILAPSLRLPEWTMNFILVLLVVGFIISVILSWIYDIHPEGGIVKTKPAHKEKTEDVPVSKNSWKIATYVSVFIIIGLLVLNIFGGRKRVKIDESLAKSIAVLPFHNYSGDPNQDFICFGLTDEIISHLYKVESFAEVRSLTSVLNYQDANRNIPLIAQELDVNYILEGSYKRIGNEIRITAQLIEPKSDKHIWLHNYDLHYNEIIGIPAEIALQIADHLKAFITENEQKKIERIPTNNLYAYELLQQTEYLFLKSNYESLDQLVDSSLKAIELDPEYAEAYSSAARYTIYRGSFMGDSDIRVVGWDAKSYVDKALELDQNNVTAHVIRGIFYEWLNWDYIRADEEYKKASDLEPGIATDVATILVFYEKMGYPEERISLPKRIGDLEETYALIVENLKNTEFYYYILLNDHIRCEEYESACVYLDSLQLTNNPILQSTQVQAFLALSFWKTGKIYEAGEIVDQFIIRAGTSSLGSPAYFIGWYFSGIGEIDSAFFWLEKAYENRSIELTWLKADPAFKNLKDDPRYWDLYERTGHKAYDDYMASKQQ